MCIWIHIFIFCISFTLHIRIYRQLKHWKINRWFKIKDKVQVFCHLYQSQRYNFVPEIGTCVDRKKTRPMPKLTSWICMVCGNFHWEFFRLKFRQRIDRCCPPVGRIYLGGLYTRGYSSGGGESVSHIQPAGNRRNVID